ncbi:MAG: hypothetical protein GF309_06980 [Candidatus Lokiarchaeota archaeon]|nr:hypothetical protein [Candidatus Lokiarchaeota archaeon]
MNYKHVAIPKEPTAQELLDEIAEVKKRLQKYIPESLSDGLAVRLAINIVANLEDDSALLRPPMVEQLIDEDVMIGTSHTAQLAEGA